MKQFLLLHIILVWGLVINADAQTQNGRIAGQLKDGLFNQPVADATVSLVNAIDSSLVSFTRTDSLGRFLLSHLQPGSYRLYASHTNFHPLWKMIELPSADTTLQLGQIFIKDKTVLEELTIHAARPPVEVNGDTLEFNAESFKTKPNAVVEDMLKKMPGIEVDKDGTVRVNGKRINRVLVNGKDFFNGDPKMATRNLSADAIDKVQVFDKQSDQAAFTGVDDGNAEKTINLKLKKDRKNMVFGKVNAAAGTERRYDAQFNLNNFKGDQQLSAIGMANNANRQGFSIMDMLNFTGQSKKMMGGGGGMVINTNGPEDFGLPVNGINNNEGIVTTIAGGINYNDTWKKKTDINASYFHNDLIVNNTRIVNRQNILPGNDFTWKQNSSSDNKTGSNRFNFSADNKMDSFNSIKFTSIIGYQKGNTANQSDYKSLVEDGKILNNGFANSTNTTEGYNTSNTLLYRHKFKKRSRTFSLNASMQYNDSRLNGTLNSINNFFTNGTIGIRDTLNQVSKLNGITQGYGANISYTEPLSKRSLLELRGFYNTNQGNLERTTFDYNKASGKHDARNNLLSNDFESRYNYMGGGINLRAQQKKYGYTVGAGLQYARLITWLSESATPVKRNFTNLLPAASFNYNFTKFKSLRIDYNSSTSQPNPGLLQPVKDVSDPLNIKEGNPGLRQSYNHNIGLQFLNANPARQKNLFAFVNYFATQHAIVNSDTIDAGGTRTTKPVNANGVYYISGTADRGFRVKKLRTRFTMGGNIAYNHSVNFINGQQNKTGVLSFAPRVSANYSFKELIEVYLSARLSYNQARYSLQPALNNHYWRQVYELEATINLPGGFNISNEFAYNKFSGRADGFNRSRALWNASVSKQVLKSKKGEIRISAYDLLKQNIGVDRNANSNYIEDIQYSALKRFFTIGITYNLQKPVTGGPKAIIRTY